MTVKISALPSASAITSDDYIPIVDVGTLTTQRATAQNILNYINASASFQPSGTYGNITGSVALNQIAYGSAANTIQGSNNLKFDGTGLYVTGSATILSSVSDTVLSLVGGTLTTQKNAFLTTATLPNPGSTTEIATLSSISTSGAGSSHLQAIRVGLAGSASGTGRYVSISVNSEVPNTATNQITDMNGGGLVGIHARAASGTSNTALYGFAYNNGNNGDGNSNTRSIGVLGIVDLNQSHASATSVGVYGTVNVTTGTGPVVGGMFTLYGASDSIGSLQRSAIIVDNAATTGSSFISRDGGVNTFLIPDGGFVEMAKLSAPSTPSSGFGRFYASGSAVYFKNDSGTEFNLTSTGSVSSVAGPNNSIQFNMSGSQSGSSNLTFDATTGLVLNSLTSFRMDPNGLIVGTTAINPGYKYGDTNSEQMVVGSGHRVFAFRADTARIASMHMWGSAAYFSMGCENGSVGRRLWRFDAAGTTNDTLTLKSLNENNTALINSTPWSVSYNGQITQISTVYSGSISGSTNSPHITTLANQNLLVQPSGSGKLIVSSSMNVFSGSLSMGPNSSFLSSDGTMGFDFNMERALTPSIFMQIRPSNYSGTRWISIGTTGNEYYGFNTTGFVCNRMIGFSGSSDSRDIGTSAGRDLIISPSNAKTQITGSVVLSAASTLHGYSAKINAQTGSTYTFIPDDSGKVVTFSTACTATVDTTLPAGFNCVIVQLGTAANQVYVSGSGTTIYNRQSFVRTAGQYAAATLVNYSGSSFIFSGDTGL